MIVAGDADRVQFVTQPDHAALVGHFADHWGNDAFARPEPSPAVAIAAHVHDDGWFDRDRRPYLRNDGTPEDFTEVPPETWISLYEEGIDAAADLQPYAGLLVSMHGAGLRRRRYGLSPSWQPDPAYADFVDREEDRQRALADELSSDESAAMLSVADRELLSTLHETGTPPEDVDSRLWRNYALLQAWDSLSLSFCHAVAPPKYASVGPVPTGPSGREVTLTVEPLGEDSFGVEPYPFDVDPLVAHVPVRTIPRKSFADERALVSDFYAADRVSRTFSLERVDA